jgi:hypothetical protein
MPWLATLSDEEASMPERPGKWSTKEVIGHLTDSAVNNLSRMVRMQSAEAQNLPGYDQVAWVERSRYIDRPWAEVLGLWFALNEHIAWVIRGIPQHHLGNAGEVAGSSITLGFLIEDYIAHMVHHLRLLTAWVRPGA